MSVPERYWRFNGPATRARVCALANLADDPFMQDWPIEVADPARTAEFLDLLDAADSDDDAFALVELLFACLDELEQDGRDAHWPRLAVHLRAKPAAFAYPLIYWSCLEEQQDGTWTPIADPEGHFPTTLVAREVLRDVAVEIDFHELRMG